MIEGLKPYPEYKESGVPWLGRVPGHWGVLPNRALFAEVNEKNHPDEEMLSVTINRGVIRQRTLLSDSSKKDGSRLDRSAYKLVLPGDIAYNKMRAWQGAIGVSRYRGIVSPAYVVVRVRGTHLPAYFHQLFRLPSFAKEAERWSYGIASDMWSLRPEHFKVIRSVAPPLDEQRAIVRFLDHATRRIDAYIRAKRKLIALLNEQKQAIIHRAVTRGLDPKVKMKDSGVPWLGQVPEHWGLVRLGALLRERGEMNDRREVEQVLSVVKDIGVIPYEQKGNIGNKRSEDVSRYKIVRPDDIVLNSMNVIIGSVGLSRYTGCLSPVYYVLVRRSEEDDPRFLEAIFKCRPFQRSLVRLGNGILAHRMRIPMELLKCELLPKPPPAEQTAIVHYIKAETAMLDAAIAGTEREIALLREYRTRLIADVVTGQLDVREAAKNLPDELPDEPDLDDTMETDAFDEDAPESE